MSNYLPHQIAKGLRVVETLKKYGVCYLAGQVRSGKTRTALYAVAQLGYKRVLWLTKKAAIPGILKESTAVGVPLTTVTNYEQAAKLSADDYDFVVVDEAHQLGTVGKPSLRIRAIRKLALDKPVLLLSGTPSAETTLGLYHQFCITKYSPLKFKNFYEFFHHYGIPTSIWVNGRKIEQYKKSRPELMEHLAPYFVEMSQDDAGITAKAQDRLHIVPLLPKTKQMIETIKTEFVAWIGGAERAFESEMAVRAVIHQVESGSVLLDGEIFNLENSEVVDYIREVFGDSPDVAVMAHFRSTREKIAKCLPNVHVYSSDGHAEGTSLAHYKHFVVANSGYSGAKFIQRRERGVLIGRDDAAVVHHIVTDAGVSRHVYKAVSDKRDFNLAMFRKMLHA